MKRRLLILSLTVVLGLGSQALAAKGGKGGGGGGGGGDDEGSTPPYQLVRLPGVDAGNYVAESVSNEGANGIYVVGSSDSDVQTCLWRVGSSGVVAETVVLSPGLVRVLDVNRVGMVAGEGTVEVLLDDGTTYDQPVARVTFSDYFPDDPSTWIDLNTPGLAMALTDPDENNIVRVVGVKHVDPAADILQGMQWDIDVTTGAVLATVELADFGLDNVRLYDCNSFGEMAGWQSPGESVEETEVWGPMVAYWSLNGNLDFEYLPEPVPQTFVPLAIDDQGNIVGRDAFPAVAQHYFVSANGSVVNLSTVTGADIVTALDVAMIGGNSQVVGSYWNKRAEVAGYVWENGQLTDLDQLLGTSDVFVGEATGINSGGVICGAAVFGSRRNRVQDGYVLIPAPTE